MENHTPSWEFYSCEVDDKLASISLDLNFQNTAPLASHSKLLWVSVRMLYPDKRGLSSSKEAPILGEIEDAIAKALEQKLQAVQVGRLKSDGTQDLFFYAPSTLNFEDIVEDAMYNFPEYAFACEKRDDERWEDYFGLLMPDEYQLQCIQNRKVIQQLEQHGDHLDQEREVDHWLRFTTREQMEQCCAEAEKLGYKVVATGDTSKNKDYDGKPLEHPFFAQLSRVDNVQWNNVNAYVWQLCELARNHHGQYDGWGCSIQK